MTKNALLREIRDNLKTVIAQDTDLGRSLWKEFLTFHPADIAQFLLDLDRKDVQRLYAHLPKRIALEVFEEGSDQLRQDVLAGMDDAEKIEALHTLNADELTDLFELFSDDELKKYLNLLHKKSREKVLSLLKFAPESAGGIMDSDVLTLREGFTVEKSIKLLQRLKPSKEVHQQIYVTDKEGILVGHIHLEELVLQNPKARIGDFMRTYELVAFIDEDQEKIAHKMVHYNLMTVPVVDKEYHFLGVIPSDTLVDVIMEEASEDAQRMAALPPLRYSYFETSFWRLLYERSYILVALLLIESFSGIILRSYEAVLGTLLLTFVPMLTNTGGCTSSQTSAMVIQGMASGDIRRSNFIRFLRREFLMALMIGLLLGFVAFIRVFATTKDVFAGLVVSGTITLIVLTSGMLGSSLPIGLKKLNLDPAFSAGPFLATLMDIFGVLIYCLVARSVLG